MPNKHKRALMAPFGGFPSFIQATPLICNVEGDPPEPPPGDTPEAKFSQADVDKMIRDRLSKAERKFADYDDLKAKAGQVDVLTTQMSELQQQMEDAGKSAEEKERARSEREAKALKDKLAALHVKAEEAEAKALAEITAHRQTRAAHSLSTALGVANVHPQAAEDALRALMSESELEFAEDGSFSGITLSNGTRHEASALKDAAVAFLETKPFYAKGAPGGAGVKPPTGGGTTSGEPLHKQSIAELLEADAARRAS